MWLHHGRLRALLHVKRNACASMAMQKWIKFPCKEESYGQVAYVGVVDIHHHVLKSTTSARGRGARCWLLWFVWFVLFIWLNQTNQINQRNRELPLGLALRYG
jgi:hypothetical protein